MLIPRQSPSSSPADQVFHLFPSLPPELRFKIWQYNLPQSRVVSIRLESPSPLDRYPNPRGHRGCLSSAQIPANLHVCAEARGEALKQYSLSFGIATQGSQVFFNPERDILYFGSRDGFKATECQFKLFTSMVGPEELAHVRRLAINDSIFWPYPEYMSTIAADITVDVLNIIRTRFPNLDELIFVPKDENPVYGDAVFVEPLSADSRLLCQVHEGMQIVVQANPEWRIPEWSVRVLSTVGQFCDSDMTMAIDDNTMQGIEEAVTQYLSPMDKGILNCFHGHQPWVAATIHSSNEHFLGPVTRSIGHW